MAARALDLFRPARTFSFTVFHYVSLCYISESEKYWHFTVRVVNVFFSQT